MLKLKKDNTWICYGISAFIYIVILLWGLLIDRNNLFGYSIVSFYTVIPITSFTTAFILGIKNSRLKWQYPFLFAVLGVVIAIATLQRIIWIFDVLALLTLPAFFGLGIGVLIKKNKD